MKNLLIIFFMLCSLGVAAQNSVHYGYAPDNLSADVIKAQGTGENAYICGMICLDPEVDPVVKRLKGVQVKGVRCYLRADYQQKRQKYSHVMYAQGSVDAEPTKTLCNFKEGWNEILFDTPVTIGDEKLFIGYQVYELLGTPYPLVSYAKASVPGGYWVNSKREGWVEYSDRGTLFIQAILDDSAAPLLENCVYAQPVAAPLSVAPSSEFDAEVYVHNRSAKAVNKITVEAMGKGDAASRTHEVALDVPIAGYTAQLVGMKLHAGSETGTNQPLQLTVTKVDDQEAQPSAPGTIHLYVTEDVFVRIPLVEEFTSQACTNCPYMIYYLDQAMEEYDGDLLYVTHHSGFKNDAFTKPMDQEVLYLFGSEYTYNPAVMYDRRVINNELAPVNGAKEAKSDPYMEAIVQAASHPAMARVDVEVTDENGKLACTVSGRVSKEMIATGEQFYLSAYLVEDGISTKEYPQLGFDAEDAPADLEEKFRHNGVKRHVFNVKGIGDALTFNETNEFSVSYDAIELDKSWNLQNCKVIAFVHPVNKDDMFANVVLNAGSCNLDALVSGVDAVSSDASEHIRFLLDGEKTLKSNLPLTQWAVYTLSGASVSKNQPLDAGVYVIRYMLPNGQINAQKILVD